MENLDRRMLLAGLGLVGAAAAASASAGSLNPPPGPVLPTGKSTDEIEPRVAVQSLAGDASNIYIISQPGSYYLTGNINGAGGKNGISIQADGVTLDLNGFALIGEATGSGIGVNVPAARTSLCVRNGTVRAWRSHGVSAQNASSSVLEQLRALVNIGDGLRIGNESAVRDCVMTGNTGNGLLSNDRVLVTGCVADVNGGSGMALGSDVTVLDCLVARGLGTTAGLLVADRSTVSRCTATRNADTGIEVGQASTVVDCNVAANANEGIHAGRGSTVRNCTSRSNSWAGIFVYGGCHVVGNTCDSNGINLVGTSFGIVAFETGSRIEGNTCTNNYGGFDITTNNLVVRNSARGNGPGLNFSLSSGSAAVVDVSSLYLFNSTQPWVNFQF